MTLDAGPRMSSARLANEPPLVTVARRMAQVGTRYDLSIALADAALGLTQADGAYVALKDGDGFVSHSYALPGGVMAWVRQWSEREALASLSPDAPVSVSVPCPETQERFGVTTSLVTPLRSLDGHLIGFLEVQRAAEQWPDTAQDMLLCLTEIALPSIQNVLARERLQEAQSPLKVFPLGMGRAFGQEPVLGPLLRPHPPVPPQGGPWRGAKGAVWAPLDYLRDSSERLAAVLRSVDDGIIVRDVEGRFRYANEAAANVLGFACPEDLIGLDAQALFAQLTFSDAKGRPLSKEELFGQWPDSVGRTTRAEVYVRPHDRSWERVLLVRTSPVLDENHQLRSGVIAFSDITERVRSQRLRDQFLSMVTHELRSPLAVIKMGVALAAEDNGFTLQDANEVLSDIGAQANRLMTLVDNLLDMAQIEAGTFSVVPAPGTIRQAVNDALGRLPGPIAGKVRTQVPDSLPVLRLDVPRITQVLVNLLTNAGQFGLPGTPIELTASLRDCEVEVCVANTGPAIPPAKMPLLFQKFSQLGPHNRGAGLGLAVSRHIVEAHRGRIWAESFPAEQLTRFTFTIPLDPLSPATGAPAP